MAQILVLDDDPRLARMLQEQLSGAGHACHAEVNPQAALAFLEKHDVDLFVLDVMLPGISGFEVCRRVRADSRLFALPILFVSAMNGEEEVMHGLAQGADDYVTKPINMPDFIRRVNRLLATSAEIRDESTDMPGSTSIRHEVHKALSRKEAFALVYSELLNLHEFSRSVGVEARSRAVRHLARGLVAIAQELKIASFRAGHLGGGHFVCILEQDKAMRYCQFTQHLWQEHIEKLYESVGQEKALREAMARREKDPTAPLPILDTLFCIAYHDGKTHHTVQELFDTLSHLREGAMRGNTAGIYTDRRQ